MTATTTELDGSGGLETDGLDTGFAVRLDNFEGPFDLLLSLIGKHKLDVTEVALSKVTDEFIAHIKVGGKAWDLEVTTSFLLVASTLLDLKAARLLPQGDVEDEEDLALLDARDLLFARLLQYKAFKQVAGVFEARMAGEEKRHPRAADLAHPPEHRLRPRAGGHRRRPAQAVRHDDLPGALRRRARHPHPGGTLPVAARALP